MGETLAQTICGNRIQYNPGHWFNSAKFLDIEYQTYGWVFGERRRQITKNISIGNMMMTPNVLQ